MKLVVEEGESAALRTFLRRRTPLVSSAVARTEVLRAALTEAPGTVGRARECLAGIGLVRVSDRVLNDAGTLPPPELRSLDAIHVATAMSLGAELDCVVTYDRRMVAAAQEAGLRVTSPS